MTTCQSSATDRRRGLKEEEGKQETSQKVKYKHHQKNTCTYVRAAQTGANRCSVSSDVSHLAAESPGCGLCRQSCGLCSCWTSRWSPSRPERDTRTSAETQLRV